MEIGFKNFDNYTPYQVWFYEINRLYFIRIQNNWKISMKKDSNAIMNIVVTSQNQGNY